MKCSKCGKEPLHPRDALMEAVAALNGLRSIVRYNESDRMDVDRDDLAFLLGGIIDPMQDVLDQD